MNQITIRTHADRHLATDSTLNMCLGSHCAGARAQSLDLSLKGKDGQMAKCHDRDRPKQSLTEMFCRIIQPNILSKLNSSKKKA